MPEPISTWGLCYLAGHTTLNIYARGRNAVSSEALAAQKSAIEIVECVERSHALFGGKGAAFSQLRAMAGECSEAGWDGDDGRAVNPLAVIMTECFLRALPEDIPL